MMSGAGGADSTAEDVRVDRATGDGGGTPIDPVTAEEHAAAAAHLAMTPMQRMPASVRLRVERSLPVPRRRPVWPAMVLAAGVAVLVGGGILASRLISARDLALDQTRGELAEARRKAEEGRTLIERSRAATASLEAELASAQRALADARGTADELTSRLSAEVAERRRLAEAARAQTDLAERLARVTAELDEARLTIARFEAPVDPATLAGNRRKLLEVPGTVRVAWAPFDLPDAPAEQRDIQGDVVWNDELQTGYLRFVGLKVNDPAVEQYQVWVIDERGMEQKVSGGVFNATAEGEVIVPIRPGIDVGRVALFAVTIEKPGGTWVPDLRRRVVVAPRG